VGERRCQNHNPISLHQVPSCCNIVCVSTQVETEDEEFSDEFVGERDPSILHFLLASGDRISSKQASCEKASCQNTDIAFVSLCTIRQSVSCGRRDETVRRCAATS